MNNRLKNIAALAMGILVAVVTLEIFLQCYNPLQFRQKGDQIILPINQVIQGSGNSIPGVDSIVTHTKNKHGFRGPSFNEKYENSTKIIAVGGSTTECKMMSDGQDWPALLMDHLNAGTDNYWINNAGLDGHSTFGHTLLLTDHVLDHKPDYILFLIGCNDLGVAGLNNFDKKQIKKVGGLKAFLLNHSEIVSTIVNIKRGINAKKANLWHQQINVADLTHQETIDSSLHLSQLSKLEQNYIPQYKSRITYLTKLCTSNRIQPIFITQPNLLGRGVDPITGVNLETVTYFDERGKEYFEKLSLYNDALIEATQSLSIPCIDLARLLPHSSEYYYDGLHYNVKGNQKVAEILQREIKHIIE